MLTLLLNADLPPRGGVPSSQPAPSQTGVELTYLTINQNLSKSTAHSQAASSDQHGRWSSFCILHTLRHKPNMHSSRLHAFSFTSHPHLGTCCFTCIRVHKLLGTCSHMPCHPSRTQAHTSWHRHSPHQPLQHHGSFLCILPWQQR